MADAFPLDPVLRGPMLWSAIKSGDLRPLRPGERAVGAEPWQGYVWREQATEPIPEPVPGGGVTD